MGNCNIVPSFLNPKWKSHCHIVKDSNNPWQMLTCRVCVCACVHACVRVSVGACGHRKLIKACM